MYGYVSGERVVVSAIRKYRNVLPNELVAYAGRYMTYLRSEHDRVATGSCQHKKMKVEVLKNRLFGIYDAIIGCRRPDAGDQ